MSEPDEICEICSKPLEDDPPTKGYVKICATCQGEDEEEE